MSSSFLWPPPSTKLLFEQMLNSNFFNRPSVSLRKYLLKVKKFVITDICINKCMFYTDCKATTHIVYVDIAKPKLIFYELFKRREKGLCFVAHSVCNKKLGCKGKSLEM